MSKSDYARGGRLAPMPKYILKLTSVPAFIAWGLISPTAECAGCAKEEGDHEAAVVPTP